MNSKSSDVASSQKQPIVTRIQSHKRRAVAMLRLGVKRVREQNTTRLTPAFAQFGGRKFKLAAQKMRFLDVQKMGRVDAETRIAFAESIPNKFRDVQKLIHFSPNFTRDASIWSELEKTLPTQESSSFETPPQPNELRQGSVIQKFSMFPKQGQPIESFRKQAQSIPKPKKKEPPTPPPKVAPKSRMFSRIQEVTDRDPVREETPISMGTPEEKEIESPKDTVDTVQRQPDPQPIPEPLALEVPPDQEEEAPSAPVVDLPSQAEEQPAPRLKKPELVKEDQLEKPTTRRLPTAKPVSKRAKETTAKPPLLKAKPASPARQIVRRETAKPPPQKTPKLAPPAQQQPVSRPEKKEDTIVESPSAKPESRAARPKPKAESPPRVARPGPEIESPPHTVPSKPKAEPPSHTASPEREAESPPHVTPPPKPKAQPLPQARRPQLKEDSQPSEPAPEPKEEISSPFQQELEDDVSTALQPPKEPSLSTPPKMTLRKRVERYKWVGKAIKSLQPEKNVRRISHSMRIAQKPPMISRDKYRPVPRKMEAPYVHDVAEVSDAPEDFPFPGFIKAPPQPPLADLVRRTGTESVAAPQPQLEEGLARPAPTAPSAPYEGPMTFTHARLPGEVAQVPQAARLSRKGAKPSPQRPEEEKQPSYPEEERSPQPLPIPEPEGAIIQHFGEDGVGLEGEGVIRREPEEEEADLSQDLKRVKVDLDQLAADVLPFVKRILEIESERLSRNF